METKELTKIQELEDRLAKLEGKIKDTVSIIVFSQDLDKALAAFIIATGAAALGQKTSLYFTFWGINVIRKNKKISNKKFKEAMMTLISPRDSTGLSLSQGNFFGLGAKAMRSLMKDKNVASLEDLMSLAHDLGITLYTCDMSRELMKIELDELIEGLEPCGIGGFLGEALKSRMTLFI